jgi:ATP-dependent DNA helicase DinG
VAVVDLETTGLADDPSAEILEIGIVLLDPPGRVDGPDPLGARGGLAVATLDSLVRPRGRIPRAVERLTGLRDADVADAPGVRELSGAVAQALSGRTLVAHNAAFERSFLSRYVSPRLESQRFLDTQDLLALTHPDAPDLRLETFTRSLLQSEERHRALDDALDTARVLSRVATGAAAGEPRYVTARNALETYAPDSPWLALLGGGPAFAPPGDDAQFVPIADSDEPPVPFDADAIASVLADEARCRRWLPGYRVREEQIRIAREFVHALAEGGRLLLEGGTGVGKSLAYLAAAIPFAMERDASGLTEPVVVSTRTKLLQDQLLGKDIAAAAALLGHPELRALSIKGRANYVCGRRFQRVLAEGREPRIFAEDRLAYAALSACARTRRHGEVGTLPGALLLRFPPLRDLVRRSVAARAEHCTREECAQERSCPFARRRAALARAHLVVANHDLLLRWPPDYPAFSQAIVDEAHELGGVVDEVYAREVRPADVLERIDDLFGRPADVQPTPALLPAGRRRAIQRDARAWRRGVQQDLTGLGRSLASRASEYGEVQLPVHADVVLREAASLALSASERLEALAAAALEHAPEGGVVDEESSGLERACGELREAAATLRAVFSEAGEDAVAAFEHLDPPYDQWRLAVRPVKPASVFHERFAERLSTLACVSASLFVGGDPFAALGELELETRGDAPVARVSVPSPFPYAEHMRVVALRETGDPVEATAGALADLARLLGGRTLGLFTSLRRMRDVAELLSRELRTDGLEVLAPRRSTDDPLALVQRFARAAGGSVLLGARSFWQGLDIPGDALQAVVIEKLPFERPTELSRRRESRLRQEGEDAFARYTTGKMLLNLKQMLGRLIRSEEDRGLVVIVDARTDRPYFERLDEALPAGSRVVVADRCELPALLADVGIGRS